MRFQVCLSAYDYSVLLAFAPFDPLVGVLRETTPARPIRPQLFIGLRGACFSEPCKGVVTGWAAVP
jgi:hypothetical protein